MRQHLVQFGDQRVRPAAEELEHFPESGRTVESVHVEVIAFDVEGSDDVVADHLEPDQAA